MIANYHTHTIRCGHAVGEEREYVESAIKGGLKILGFSDHTPQPFPKGYISGVRMRMEQLEDYVNTVLSLKKEYAKDIEIHLGLEVEYFPAYFDELVKYTADYGIEYFLLGQHFLENGIDQPGVGSIKNDPAYMEHYFKQVTEAIETGMFTYFAHPDMIRDMGDAQLYDREIRKLCQTAKKHALPLEINLLGIRDSRHYPNEAFFKVVGEEGCQVILGSDAHAPKDVWRPEDIERAHKLVEKYHLNLIDTAELRKPVRM